MEIIKNNVLNGRKTKKYEVDCECNKCKSIFRVNIPKDTKNDWDGVNSSFYVVCPCCGKRIYNSKFEDYYDEDLTIKTLLYPEDFYCVSNEYKPIDDEQINDLIKEVYNKMIEEDKAEYEMKYADCFIRVNRVEANYVDVIVRPKTYVKTYVATIKMEE